ncbi:glycine oxidase ThiO [soil metagenome]
MDESGVAPLAGPCVGSCAASSARSSSGSRQPPGPLSGSSFGIAGAGLLGRLLAYRLTRAGHAVTAFDPADGPFARFDGRGAAAFTAAGMLSPVAELDHAQSRIAALGWRSIELWKAMVSDIETEGVAPLLAMNGSLMLAHAGDMPAATRGLSRIAAGMKSAPLTCRGLEPRPISVDELRALEPSLHGASHAWLLPSEGLIDAPRTMDALHRASKAALWRWSCKVADISDGVIELEDGERVGFDHVFDVRGAGAKPQLTVRGVRGETVWLELPDHGLTRPVRLLHPRHRLYLVPRSGDSLLLGASEIESEDRSPVSLRSAVELMAAAHSVMPSLAEARIVRLDRNLRPALPDNLPRIESSSRTTRINGLFRHGWLIGPALVEDALSMIGLGHRATATAAVSNDMQLIS